MGNLFITLLFSILSAQAAERLAQPGGSLPAPTSTQNECQAEMEAAKCTEFLSEHFKTPEEYDQYARKCYKKDEKISDQLKAIGNSCGTAGVAAFFHNLNSYGELGVNLWNYVIENKSRQTQLNFLKNCNADLSCKRQLANDSGRANLTDEALKNMTAEKLYSSKTRHARAEKQRQAIRENGDFISKSTDEKQSLLASARAKSQKEGEEKFAALKNLVAKRLNDLGIKMTCYNGEKQLEMLCYGVSLLLLDPLALTTGGVAGTVWAIKKVAGVVKTARDGKAVTALFDAAKTERASAQTIERIKTKYGDYLGPAADNPETLDLISKLESKGTSKDKILEAISTCRVK